MYIPVCGFVPNFATIHVHVGRLNIIKRRWLGSKFCYTTITVQNTFFYTYISHLCYRFPYSSSPPSPSTVPLISKIVHKETSYMYISNITQNMLNIKLPFLYLFDLSCLWYDLSCLVYRLHTMYILMYNAATLVQCFWTWGQLLEKP